MLHSVLSCCNTSLYFYSSWNTTALALRYGTCSHGISQFYLHIHTFNLQSVWAIPSFVFPAIQLVLCYQRRRMKGWVGLAGFIVRVITLLIYQPQKDERLSRPWCKVAPAEIRTRNLPNANPALYHTATSCAKLISSTSSNSLISALQ